MDKNKIKEALEFARENGLKSITVDGIVFDLDTVKAKKDEPILDLKAEELIKPIHPWDDLSEEEILFYHTPYFDELQEKKQQQIEHAKIQKDLSDDEDNI